MKVNKKFFYGIFFTMFFSALLFSQVEEFYSIFSIHHKYKNRSEFKVSGTIRFKNNKNYYRKIYSGFVKSFIKHFDFGVFFGEKCKKKITEWKNESFLFQEVAYKTNAWGKIMVKDRNRIEYFFNKKEFRYRNMIRFNYTINSIIKLWMGDEIKYFFKEEKIKKNEFFLGMVLKPKNFVFVNIFYDYKRELIRNFWEAIDVLGIKISFMV